MPKRRKEMKKKTLVVEDLRDCEMGFKVKKVVNSIRFKINEYLIDDQVRAYCKHPEWTVNIIPQKVS
jgi:hypothetical protein